MLIQNCEFIDVNCQNCKIQTRYCVNIFCEIKSQVPFLFRIVRYKFRIQNKILIFYLAIMNYEKKSLNCEKTKSQLLLFIYSVVDTGFHKYNIYQQEAIMLTSLFLTP